MTEKLRVIYDLITSQNNFGIMSYNAKEFGLDTNTCFIWDNLYGIWLICSEPLILNAYGILESITEVISDAQPRVVDRWSDVLVSWRNPFDLQITVNHFEGPTAFAFQYETN
jgi:hypothetical protein